LHFGEHCHHYSPYQALSLLEDLLGALRSKPGDYTFDAVVFSGDFPWGANQAGFDIAADFLRYLEWVKYFKPSSRLLIPGNHDISWIDPESAKPRSMSRDDAERQYRRFSKNASKLLTFVHVPDQPKVALIGLNSSLIEGTLFKGAGYVGYDQIYALLEPAVHNAHYVGNGVNRVLIVFLHHHLTVGYDQPLRAVMDRDTAGTTAPVRDAASVLKGLREYGVQVILHGHLHCPAHEIYSRQESGDSLAPIHILSAGSPSVAARHCGMDAGGTHIHHFQILEFNDQASELVVEWFVAPASTKRQWKSDRKVTIPLHTPAFNPANARQRRLDRAMAAARNRDAFETVLTIAAVLEGDHTAYRQIMRGVKEALHDAEKQNLPRPKVSGDVELKALLDKAFQSLKDDWAKDPKQSIHSLLADPASGAIRFAHEIMLERMMELDEAR
jgi:3',5'-cyclic AMP phosphodiesterase CpdA